MERAIMNLSPGICANIDATWSVAKQAIGVSSCMVFILGAMGEIVAYAALRRDCWTEMLPLLYG